MPQFDKITFFNQVFWLFVFFSGSYLVFLKFFLPKLSSVLKARAKKLQQGSSGVSTFVEENGSVSSEIKQNLGAVSNVVNSAVSLSNDLSTAWVNDKKIVLSSVNLDKSHQSFEQTLHKNISINHIISKLS